MKLPAESWAVSLSAGNVLKFAKIIQRIHACKAGQKSVQIRSETNVSIENVSLVFVLAALCVWKINSPRGISPIKVNSISEVAPFRSAVNSWVVHVQVESFAKRLEKSEDGEEEPEDTEERPRCPLRLCAKPLQTHLGE